LRHQHHAKYLEGKPDLLRRYIKALLRADAAIKADVPKAVEVLDAAKFYRVDKATLAAALPRQMPQVDVTKGGAKGMEIALADMMQLGYIKTPLKIIDTSLLAQALG
jgi:ABC-type nitrate/sulfonate/bicarbonate transport system substrate-binding protein